MSSAAKLTRRISAWLLNRQRGFAEAKRIYAKVYASDDAQEGPRAFAEKRAPLWQGR